MATYAPIPTGYVDSGPLGALWAGQNAAAQEKQNEMSNLADMMDLMTKGQTYDQTERMDPLRVDQLRGTNRSTDLANTLSAYQLPSKQRQADADLAALEAQFKFPGFFEGEVAGRAGLSRKNVVEADVAEQTKAGRIIGDNATNQGKQVDYAKSLLPGMRGMDELQMVRFMQNRGVSPDIAGAYLEVIRGKGGIDKLLDNMSRTPATVAAERLQAQKDAADIKKANLSAGAQIAAAERQARAAETANDKLAYTSILGTTNALASQLKVQIAQATESLQQYKKPEDQDATYRAILAGKTDLENRLKDANSLLWTVTTKLGGVPVQSVGPAQPTAVVPQAPVTPTPAAATSQRPITSNLGQVYGPFTPDSVVLANARAGDPAAIEYLRTKDAASAAKAKAILDEAQRYRSSGGKSTAAPAAKLDSATEADLQKYLQQP